MCAWRKLEPEEVAFTQAVHAVFLREKELGFEEAVREYRRVEAEFVQREHDEEWKVVETKRRITEWLLNFAYRADQPMEVCRQIWEEMLQRGFTDLERRYTMGGIYVRCCQMNGAFDKGLAITESAIAELEQLFAAEAEAPTLTPAMRYDCEQSLRIYRKIRDELKAGDLGDTEDEAEAAEREEARRNRGDTEFVQSVSALFKRADAEGMSFEEELREMRRLEAESVQRAVDGGLNVLETKRRITGWILGRALERRAPLDVCRQIWEEQLQRGFSKLERRLAMSGIYAECCQLHGAFEEGLAIIEPLIPETEQALADTTLPWPERRDYEELLQSHRKLRDALKAGIREPRTG
ncbi:hypothetical protein [Polyangium aurulentum]|uniref:hypothetical protein n=1 Tax=Polyangium aurulentum TaxID=2567896 RepID=UPI0010AE6D21|nr:hypothetical protein [Polyangium aurulentum]UQA63442.1 hypothetical protein E8A73_024400 [Polyangium aurulentum]